MKILTDDQVKKFFPKRFCFVDENAPIGASFFPNIFKKYFGKNPVKIFFKKESLEMKPFLTRFIQSFLENQGPGSTDMEIPLIGEDKEKIYVVSFDGGCGDLLQIWDKAKFDKKKAAEEIVNFHNLRDSDDISYWDDNEEINV